MRSTRSKYAASNKAIGQRGKDAEKLVREHLELVARRRATFTFERRYDARSAGGHFPAQAGDFGYFQAPWARADGPYYSSTINGLIEVKETKEPYRLPQKNFSDKRINRLTLRELAGTEVVILVLHTEEGLWRSPPFSIFRDDPTAASWDLSDYPTFDTVELALRKYASLCP